MRIIFSKIPFYRSCFTNNKSLFINIISPLNNSFLDSSSVLAEWNSTDSVSGLDHFEIRMDGGTWLNMGISENHTFTSLSDGEHVFEVKAIDNTKNIMLSSVKFSIDATAPTIVDNSPTGTNIPLDTAISITFSEEMDESSVKIAVQGNEKIKQPNDDSWDVTGKITWDENVLTFTPTNDLEHTSEYTVFLIGCTDLIGHSVIAFNWSFESKVQEQITGQVIDKDGNPIPDAIIILSSGSTTSTDNEGYFTFILVPDNYELTVNKTGYTDKKLDVKLNTGELKDLGSLKIAEFEGTVDPNPDGSDGDPKDETSFLESSGGIAIAGIVIIIIVVVIILLVVFMMKKKKNEPKLPNEPRPPVPPIPPGSNI